MMEEKRPKFARVSNSDFHSTLNKRVNDYFKINNLSKYGNFGLVVKTIIVIAMYLVPYFITMTGVVTAPWLIILLWIVMGIGLAGIGMNVMHDANHGSYSKNSTINKILGLSLNFMGGDAALWRLQHNNLHHTYTNIEGVDDDLNSAAILRFSPHQKKLKIHRYQHIYAWFLYGLMSVSWMTWGDIGQAVRFYKRGFYPDKKTYQKEMAKIVAWKVFFYIYMIILPIIFLPGPFWVFLVASIATHFTVSWILSTVFQTAHVMPDSEFPLPDKDGNLENSWAVHQFLTTNNYAPKNPVLDLAGRWA